MKRRTAILMLTLLSLAIFACNGSDKATPTAQSILGTSSIVARDETGFLMPQDQVPLWSIARGWGDTQKSGGTTIAYLKHGATISIFERQGLDIKVKANGNIGWVRGWFVQKYRDECLRDYR